MFSSTSTSSPSRNYHLLIDSNLDSSDSTESESNNNNILNENSGIHSKNKQKKLHSFTSNNSNSNSSTITNNSPSYYEPLNLQSQSHMKRRESELQDILSGNLNLNSNLNHTNIDDGDTIESVSTSSRSETYRNSNSHINNADTDSDTDTDTDSDSDSDLNQKNPPQIHQNKPNSTLLTEESLEKLIIEALGILYKACFVAGFVAYPRTKLRKRIVWITRIGFVLFGLAFIGISATYSKSSIEVLPQVIDQIAYVVLQACVSIFIPGMSFWASVSYFRGINIKQDHKERKRRIVLSPPETGSTLLLPLFFGGKKRSQKSKQQTNNNNNNSNNNNSNFDANNIINSDLVIDTTISKKAISKRRTVEEINSAEFFTSSDNHGKISAVPHSTTTFYHGGMFSNPLDIELLAKRFFLTHPEDSQYVRKIVRKTMFCCLIGVLLFALEYCSVEVYLYNFGKSEQVFTNSSTISFQEAQYDIFVAIGFTYPIYLAFIGNLMLAICAISILLHIRLVQHSIKQIPTLKDSASVKKLIKEWLSEISAVRKTCHTLQFYLATYIILDIAIIVSLVSLSFSFSTYLEETPSDSTDYPIIHWSFINFVHEATRISVFSLVPLLTVVYLGSTLTKFLNLFESTVNLHMYSDARYKLLLPLSYVAQVRASFTIFSLEISRSLWLKIIIILFSASSLFIRNASV